MLHTNKLKIQNSHTYPLAIRVDVFPFQFCIYERNYQTSENEWPGWESQKRRELIGAAHVRAVFSC